MILFCHVISICWSHDLQVSPVCAQIETTDMIKFQLSVGDHVVRFSPKDPFKDDLTVRSLPTLYLNGTVQGSRRTMIPRVSLELSVKQVVVDITTDVLNQLLILQNSFIKVSELFIVRTCLLQSPDHPPPTHTHQLTHTHTYSHPHPPTHTHIHRR